MNDWILFRPRLRKGEIWLEYEDDLGFRWPAPGDAAPSLTVVAAGWKNVRVMADLKDRIAVNVAELREQSGPHRTGLSPLPIFVGGALSLAGDEVFALIVEAIHATGCNVDADTLQFVRLARDPWSVPRPFRLPLRIGWNGGDADAALTALRRTHWIDDVVREHALQIVPELASMASPPNILVLGKSGVSNEDWIAVDARRQPRPQLVVSFDPKCGAAVLGRKRPLLPAGVSFIDAGDVPLGPQREAVVKAIVYGVVHDQPLHEAVKSALREHGGPLSLISDPASNHSLRMNDALIALFEEAKTLSDRMAFNRAVLRVGRGIKPRRRPRGLASRDRALPEILEIPAVDDDLRELWSGRISFDEERRGMKPAADAARKIKEVRAGVEAVVTAHARDMADPDLRELFYPRERRSVDIALLRRDLRGDGDSLFVPKDMSLRRAGRYRLRVQIGRPLPLSIVVGRVPPIDDFLPPPSAEAGHFLTVVLYPLDFTATTATARPLLLPRHGPSQPVFFDFIAPKATGPAKMRVAIYYELPPELLKAPDRVDRYHNQLVQSFVIETTVKEREEEGSTVARVEVTQRCGLESMRSLTPRLASLGFNESSPGHHDFHFKEGSEHGSARIDASAANRSMKDLRTILEDATYVGEKTNRQPRFPETTTLELGGQRETDFDDAIRRLARGGSDLWLALKFPLRENQRKILDQIRESNDRVVQIIRFDPNYVFAWPMLYDYPPPPEQPGQPEPLVCKGFLREKEGKPISCSDCLADCLHPSKTDAFCIWGFWGFRLSVEQVLHIPGQERPTVDVVEPARRPAVGVNVGIDGPYASKLTAELQTNLAVKYGVLPIVPPQDLMQTLWSDADRPPIVILLGHYQNHPRGLGPGIQIAGGRWLMRRDVAARTPAWQKPNTIVVMAACESAADELETLVSFVNAFANACAAAVVGTETDIFEGLACRLAKALAAELTADGTLGQSILDFRRSLLRLLSPLGLSVTAYGDAGLHLARGGES
jgi:hypothetical protein